MMAAVNRLLMGPQEHTPSGLFPVTLPRHYSGLPEKRPDSGRKSLPVFGSGGPF